MVYKLVPSLTRIEREHVAGDPNADFFCDRANNCFVLHALTDIPVRCGCFNTHSLRICNRKEERF